MQFTKMHGCGNDYVLLDCTKEIPPDLPGLAVRLSDRHFGVGSDGLICVCPSQRAEIGMRMFNADGSEGAMCGNGLRCVGRFALEKGLACGHSLRVETKSGVKRLYLPDDNGPDSPITAGIGRAEAGKTGVLEVDGKEYHFTEINVGNPHIVLLIRGLDGLDLPQLGPWFEHHPALLHPANVEFVEVLSRGCLRCRVWERGSGETLACGTGACAVVAACASQGLCDREAEVFMPGGSLHVRWDRSGELWLTGPAVQVFEGEYADAPAQ